MERVLEQSDRKMKSTGIGVHAAVAGSLLVALAAQAMADVPPPHDITIQISNIGAASELKTLVHTPSDKPGASRFDAVLDHVQQGADPWLQVAAALYPATDAGNRFALLNTVSAAIQNNPTGVLRLTDTVFPIDDVCRNRLVEPSAVETRNFTQKTRDALNTVHVPALLARRDACVKLLS